MIINEQNIEEYILLAIDKELSAQEQAQLQAYLLQHPSAQALWEQYSDTVVTQEPIHYPSKVRLYAVANQQKAQFTWVKYAAALLIGVSVLTYFIVNNRKNEPELATQAPYSESKNTNPIPTVSENVDADNKNTSIAQTEVTPSDATKNSNTPIITNDVANTQNKSKNRIVQPTSTQKKSVTSYTAKNNSWIEEVPTPKEYKNNDVNPILSGQSKDAFMELPISIEALALAQQQKKIETYPVILAKKIEFPERIMPMAPSISQPNNKVKARLLKSNNIAVQNLVAIGEDIAHAYNDFKSIRKDGVQIEIALPNF
jgi:hypothetical protein